MDEYKLPQNEIAGLKLLHRTLKKKREADKVKVYEKQTGICPHCKKHFDLEEMKADHITLWHEGGKIIAENCQMLCKECNRRKSGK